MKEIFKKEDFNEVFKSVKTGRSYATYEEMVAAEAEYDRLERERMELKKGR